MKLNKDRIKEIKNFIFKNGRLLERRLFSYFFEKGSKDDVIKALIGYQNPDGGFGNGIEPDLKCPDSTAIGAETALNILDFLENTKGKVVDNLINWILKAQNSEGYIDHPPENFFNYPHQPWWKNPDNERILIIAAILKKWGFYNDFFFKNVRNFYLKTKIPEEIHIYDYPYFVYLKYCGTTEQDRKKLLDFMRIFTNFLGENRVHQPLFSRYWFYFIHDVRKEILEREVEFFINAIQEDGGLKIAFDDLPWWRPISTLDGLIILKKSGLINI